MTIFPILFLFVISVSFGRLALGQSAFVTSEQELPAHFSEIRSQNFYFENADTRRAWATDTYLPLHLKQSLNRFSDIGFKKCSDNESYAYALSLTLRGEYRACADYVDACLSTAKKTISTGMPTIIQGARCAALEYNYQRAYNIFEKGLSSRDRKSARLSPYILEFATLARYSLFPEKTAEIINLNARWSEKQKSLAFGLVEFMGNGLPAHVTKNEVYAFVESELIDAESFYSLYLKNLRISLYFKDYQYQKSYDYLVQDAVELVNPLDWWNSAFSILYAFADGADFSAADKIYQTYLPFAHHRSSLPKENNVYNYSQIYSRICRTNVLQGQARADFKKLLQDWKSGILTLTQLLNIFRDKPNYYFEKSDFLSAYAGLLVLNSDDAAAEKNYWRSHQLCPYNNRSHWGLALLERRKKHRAFPEYKANEDYVDSTLKDVEFPAEIKTYFSNWSALPPASQTRVKYASRIWAPYIKSLLEFGARSYIKMPFELLSEAPGLSKVRNSRIGPPQMPNYKFDNRLWDDVRGIGGLSVAADHEEVFQAVQGDYNLLGHEMAHQFHSYLASVRPDLSSCIDKLYAEALNRNVFSDGYAKSSVQEYFAQGITYYLIPENFPARYGLNVSWFKKNDSNFYKFMSSVEKSNGNLDKISCHEN